MVKLDKVIIKNFRTYKDEVVINFNNLTTLIGKNDAGKSTILEALEIFFNNSLIKITSKDVNVFSGDTNIEIGCVFSEIDDVILDSSIETNLLEEYLLNKDGKLEVRKKYSFEPRYSEEVYLYAYHPEMYEDESFLIQLTQSKLKTLFNSLNLELDTVDDKRVNADYRKVILKEYEKRKLLHQYIPLKKESATLWEKIKLHLPIYTLFQADRTSDDGDSEIQDPMKIAVKEVIANLEKELKNVQSRVIEYTKSVTTATIDKLKEMDSTLAESLVPVFSKEPDWASIFKFGLEDHAGIPLNKRGSGIKRMILLNFFRATAEKKFGNNDRSIIYAIEEPETAQHPNNQSILAEALIKMSENKNAQVILTTHVPGFAGMMPYNSIRYVDLVDGNKVVRDAEIDEDVLLDVTQALGVMASPINKDVVKLAIVVEGYTDVVALKHFSKIVSRNLPNIVDLNDNPSVVFILSGGSSVKYWVHNQYLKSLGIPEFHLMDRDSDIPPKNQKYCDLINNRDDNSKAFLTRKKELENYFPSEKIRSYINVPGVDIPEFEINDDMNVVKFLKDITGMKPTTIKAHLAEKVVPMINYNDIIAVDTHNEIIDIWLTEISNYITESISV